ncbi:MAG TPA: hypothetical protein DDY52_03260 [Candidatus Moranbacteria bacterium]|nr:hypothetical protein [Candidatus Moranbacteria bacterium]
MAAQNTDKFKKVTSNTGWQLGSNGIPNADAASFELVSALDIPTDTAVIITINRVDAGGIQTPGKMERIIGIMGENNTVTNCIRGVGGTAQAHSGGSVVEILIDKKLWNDLMDGILVEHNQDGTHNIPNKTIQSVINAPRGFLLNGKFTVTDTGSGLNVAIKTLAGSDPTANDPVYCRIGDTVRNITSALSRTLADGTNWMNAGSAELATKEIDYFTYLVWDSNSSAVGLSFARIPYANLVSDFSTTTTNEKHCAGYADFTTTDEVENIGRFAATLSAGAGYTWTVPTFTASNLIQRPIYETRELLYTPVLNSMVVGNGTIEGRYSIFGNKLKFSYAFTLGSTSSVSAGGANFSIPISMVGEGYQNNIMMYFLEGGVATFLASCFFITPNSFRINGVNSASSYSAFVDLTNTVPFTWGVTDKQLCSGIVTIL